MTHFCLSCGHNQTADTPIKRDGFTIDPRGGPIRYKRQPIYGLTASETCVLYTLMASAPRVVSHEVFLSRCFADDSDVQVVKSAVSRIRAVLTQGGLPQPVQTFSSRKWADCGYYWLVTTVPTLEE